MTDQSRIVSGATCPSCGRGRLFTRSTNVNGTIAVRHNRCPQCEKNFKCVVPADMIRRRTKKL